jgi:hypothetical protein
MNNVSRTKLGGVGIQPAILIIAALLLMAVAVFAEEVGDRWGTATRERDYYRLTTLPIPKDLVIEAGAFTTLPDGRLAVGTRRGDVYFIDGIDSTPAQPKYHLFATGLDEIFGLVWHDGALRVTQSCELTALRDTNNDGRADRFDVISDAWGYANYHEYAFGSPMDPKGNQYLALGLSASYHSRALFRGWAFKITPDGKSIPIASGLRSPGGIGFNETGALFYIESQGPWNSACSLKFVKEGGFMGHPRSYNWYPFAPNMGKAPKEPAAPTKIVDEIKNVPELVPYAVIFPYIRMGRSISGFTIDRTGGKFGPFENQIFLGDYTQSIVMRATTEQINGVWQGACYPFREELSTGLLNIQFTPQGNLITGGTNRGWPVRGLKPFALERLEWTGKMPFEIKRLNITRDGFKITFTKPVDPVTAGKPENYVLGTFTHIYRGAYGGPEVEQTKPKATAVKVAKDGLSATIKVDGVLRGHVHEFDLGAIKGTGGETLVHRHAYYTVNEIPK